MRFTYSTFGVLGLTVAIRLATLLRPAPWGATKVGVFLFALAFMAGLFQRARRTAGRQGVASLEESRLDVYAMAVNTFLAILLALWVPDIVKYLAR